MNTLTYVAVGKADNHENPTPSLLVPAASKRHASYARKDHDGEQQEGPVTSSDRIKTKVGPKSAETHGAS